MADKLAILGGNQAVTVPAKEQWQPPNDRIKALIGEMIDRGAYSVAGAYIPKQFEEAFASYIGSPYCFALDHGTSRPLERLLRRRRRPRGRGAAPLLHLDLLHRAGGAHGGEARLLRDRPRAPGD